MAETTAKPDLQINEQYAEKYGFSDVEDYVFKGHRGLSREVVEEISRIKGEPAWMLERRLKALEIYYQKPLPTWGGDLTTLDFENIFYYIKPSARREDNWEDVPPYIKKTFDRLGIPEAEQKFLAGAGAQYESESVYHKIKKELADQGVLFLDTDSALREHPEIVQEYFGTIIPAADNKFAALNTAVWSGGSFIYVPKGVRIEMPLQAYFRINAQNMGQFERTLIIVDEGAYVHYVEGCFLAGARVRTRTGEKRIEDIEKGDEVLTHRGRFRKVYRTMERPYRGMIYRIRYFGDSSQELQVTEEHPLLVVPRERLHNRNHEFSPEWRQASEVKPGDYLAIPVPQPEVVTEEPHAVGVLVGRGRHEPVTLSHEPMYVRDAPVQNLRERVRRMWSGDGSYDERKNTFRFNTVSRELACAFRDAVLRLGVAASINLQPREAPRQPIYAVIISSPWNERFGEIVGCPAPNGRASGSPFQLDEKYLYVPIRAVEIEEANAPVYNFSVEEDESYIAEGVVSHNCTAPIYSSDSLHSAVVEIIVKKGARCRYTTIQNWSNNVYNLVTKRAVAYENATMEWVDGNLGCLAEGSTVTTATGVKPIEALEVGERVLSLDEATGELCFRRVMAKKFSGYQHVREVAYGERRIRVTDNHPFYSYVYDRAESNGHQRYRLGYVRADLVREVIVPSASSREVDMEPALAAAGYATSQASLAPLRNVGRSNIDLPEALEVVKVSVGEPSPEPVPTWDIEVEGTGNFVAEGFIVHNSKLTMKYPSVYLMGAGAKGEVLSIAMAGPGQHQDAGGKVVHGAPHTTSRIISKSISKGGGRATYRGLLKVHKGAAGSKSNVVCDALLLDPQSRSDTYPVIEIDEDDVTIGHEATVSKVSDEQLFYLMSRGMSQDEAASMIVQGFIEPLAKELPMEYSIELNRLIQLQMEGSVG